MVTPMIATKKRLQTTVGSLAKLNVDALLVTDEINVSYLSGFTGDSSSQHFTSN